MLIPFVSCLVAMSQPAIASPAPRQLAWHRMDTYAFVHFGPNTFTDREWGLGTESADTFNPTALDCRQWVRIFKEAGMTGVILPAKHHDGFCLWPSKQSKHTVAQSIWRNGKGDVVRELSDACRQYGLKFGVYVSPWDRNHPKYGTDEYNDVFVGMLEELLTNYGPIFEVWFDGANGEGPNGKKQIYDWDRYIETVRRLQPSACIFSDAGPDIRWVGNENGIASETNWNTIDRARYFPGTPLYAELGEGKMGGSHYVPAECDVSIRPGWFYHKSQDDKVKNGEQIFDIWLKSVGRGGNLLLNVPPDTRGLIAEPDISALKEFKRLRDARTKTDLAKGKVKQEITNVNAILGNRAVIDCVDLGESIDSGQRICEFVVEGRSQNRWKTLASGTTIGNRRILTFPPSEVDAVRVRVTKSLSEPAITSLKVYPAMQTKSETPAEKSKRMKWWRDARFGMFIHWGLYAVPAGEWNGKKIGGVGEWILNSAQIKVADYEILKSQFNPVKFDAREWVRIAKDAGMKYIVITSKHHDGFALFESKQTDWDVMHTPFGRDILKELANACKDAGIKLCFYHSIMDWHHPDYLPRRAWDPRPEIQPQFERYVAYMKEQLKELLTNYGDIGILWFDGEWEATWNHEYGKDLYAYVRKLQPDIIVNNRVDKGRGGMAGMTEDEKYAGDYGTPEQEIPASGIPGVDWESCMTMNDTWGYKKDDTNWKSSETLIQNLIDCVSKGGNYLLNVGPTAEGLIPSESVERLSDVGRWMRRYSASIYGCGAGPFQKQLEWGRVTSKGNNLFLHVFDPKVERILLPGFSANIKSIRPLAGNTNVELKWKAEKNGTTVELPLLDRDSASTVFVMTVEGKPTVVDIPLRPDKQGIMQLKAIDAKVSGSARYESDKQCIGYWTNMSDTVSWTFEVDKPQHFSVWTEIACEKGSGGSEVEFHINDTILHMTVSETLGWSHFVNVPLGVVTIKKPGKVNVKVLAKTKPGNAVMNLKHVQLVPALQGSG